MSRRFKSRHGKVIAQPDAKPEPPVELTDENSYIDPMQPDCRKPNVPNARKYIRAESARKKSPARDAAK